MPDLGKTLSQARIDRGLTLEDCERDTRISKRYLDALEREDWKVFPAPVYSRAFLRTYAQHLGLNPVDLMGMFHAQSEESQYKPLPPIQTPPPAGGTNWILAAGVVIFLAIAGGFLWYSSGGDSGKTGSPAAVAPTATAAAPEALGGGQAPTGGRPVGEVKKGTVPDLKDTRLDDALAALVQAGLSYVVVETDTVRGQPGIVTSQDPAPGTKGGSATSVTLVVPRG